MLRIFIQSFSSTRNVHSATVDYTIDLNDMKLSPTVNLNNGYDMPILGLGANNVSANLQKLFILLLKQFYEWKNISY